MGTLTARHVLDRLGCGWSPDGQRRVAAAGGPAAWFDQQLRPATVPESPRVADVDGWFSYLRTSPAQRVRDQISGTRTGYAYALALSNWTILRRIYTLRPVLETMVDFWSDHFNVPALHDTAWIHRFDYDRVIRSHALGRFEDLLLGCALHPAMRLYLDNWLNWSGDPNENQGRELLELHTVGLDAGYTEDMVKDSAAILSGYTVDWGGTFDGYYSPTRHATGEVRVLDFTDPNAAADGQSVTRAYLSYLARHPATARRLARKLAVRFVNDEPSDALVDRLASVYSSSDTDIGAVLTALVESEEFLGSAKQKVRRPVDDLVATAKVLNVAVATPRDAQSWASVVSALHGGTWLYFSPSPLGPALEDPPWCSAGRIFESFRMHLVLTIGRWPADASFRPTAQWLPRHPLTFTGFVDFLSRQLLGVPAKARLTAVGRAAVPECVDLTISRTRPLPEVLVWRLIIALLDTPDHMMR